MHIYIYAYMYIYISIFILILICYCLAIVAYIDDPCRQGALFFLRHASAPGFFVVSMSGVACACFLALLLQLRHFFHVAWRETYVDLLY